jgi:hypothetical protein
MTEEEKKDYVYLVLQDLYKEFNHSVNHLLILREFLQDILNVKEGKNPIFETKSVLKK